jgi:hypothetical protein
MIHHVPAAVDSRGSAHFRRRTKRDDRRLRAHGVVVGRYTRHWRWYRAGLHMAVAVVVIGGLMAWVR